jgi:hypothetical protein
MRQISFALFLCCFIVCGLRAQQPPLKPKIGEKPGQKDIDPSGLKPLGLQNVIFIARIKSTRELHVYGEHNKLRRFETVEVNEGNGFNKEEGIFTAPVSGAYCFIFSINFQNTGCWEVATSLMVTLLKSGAAYDEFRLPMWYGNSYSTLGFTTIIPLKSGETIQLSPMYTTCRGGGYSLAEGITFSGYLIN